MGRDIADYTDQYQSLPFEPLQASYRRRRILAEIARHRPRRLLEVGCGESPLFTDLPDVAGAVIEPSPAFALHARQLAAVRPEWEVLQGSVEEVAHDSRGVTFDMVVLSCLLHEVTDPQALLAAVRSFCSSDTLLLVTVPNATSLHRLLAVAMGLIDDVRATSATQRRMQQRGLYDREGLDQELRRAGFTVQDGGTLFVKPFTHEQMQHLVDSGFMTPIMLDGWDRLVTSLPELGSEIWVSAGVAP